MYRTVLVIDGMMCTMCEAHVNDIVRKTCPGLRSEVTIRRAKW